MHTASAMTASVLLLVKWFFRVSERLNLMSGVIELHASIQVIFSIERSITKYANMTSNICMFGNIMPYDTVENHFFLAKITSKNVAPFRRNKV